MAIDRLTTAQMMQEIRAKKEEVYHKALKGETQQKFQIGAEAYTEKEWKRMLDKFDETQDEIRKELEAEREENGRDNKEHEEIYNKVKNQVRNTLFDTIIK